MTDASNETRVRALLAIQRALLGAVTPDLRLVTVDIEDGVRVRFVYACPLDDGLQEIVEDVETEVIADFDAGTTVEAVAESIPHEPVPRSSTEIGVYQRRE